MPTVEKTGQPAHQAPTGPGTCPAWFTVPNVEGSDHTLGYRLTDAPAELEPAEALAAASGSTVAAGSVITYTLTVTVTVTGQVPVGGPSSRTTSAG